MQKESGENDSTIKSDDIATIANIMVSKTQQSTDINRGKEVGDSSVN